ncbi:MAG: HU family DNA-binding protein [Paludibacter sp.]|nr:HU family DNA-binding protein [Paludibacter sp.]
MNNKILISTLAERIQLSETNVKTLLKLASEIFQKNLSEGHTIGIQGFGTFETKSREERISFNPTTKKRMLMPPRVVAGFRASNLLKDKIKSIR